MYNESNNQEIIAQMDVKSYIKTPESRKCLPESVFLSYGVENQDAILNGGSVVLRQGSYLILDMSRRSIGGYSHFCIKSFSGFPTLRISYFDRVSDFSSPKVRFFGDFVRGSCTYLGVEVPVLPADPHRFEKFSIVRTGDYCYPLIQGQQRYVCLEVYGENTSLELSDYYIYHTIDACAFEGAFYCDNDSLNRLWYSSAYTVQLATIYSDLFESVEHRILLRSMTRAKPIGICRASSDFKDFQLNFDAELYIAPNGREAMGIALCCQDRENGLILELNGNGIVLLKRMRGGISEVLSERLGQAWGANRILPVELRAEKEELNVIIGERTECFTVMLSPGHWGFCQENEAVASVQNLICRDHGKIRRIDLSDFFFERTGKFLSDGAKRDRLPWTGDLFWAFDTGWYPFGNHLKAYNTLKIMGRFQTPEGFIFGTWYPEDETHPQSGYGYYESDMFSAWYVISALYYYQLSGDERVEEFYPIIERCMGYLERQIDSSDGLFHQRYETSKGLWDHCLGDTGKNTYTNLMLLDCYRLLVSFAEDKKWKSKANLYRQKAESLLAAIDRWLYDEELGGYIKRKDWRVLCDMANSYAIGRGLASKTQAEAIAKHVVTTCRKYGKVMILMIKGLYDYGYGEQAYKALSTRVPMLEDGKIYSYVDWFGSLEERGLPETVYECMHNPPHDFGNGYNWGDLSHPDSGISGIISGQIAGLLPLRPGFQTVLLRPNPGDLREIECWTPTARGKIHLSYRRGEREAELLLTLPEGTEVVEDLGRLPVPVRYVKRYYKKTGSEK